MAKEQNDRNRLSQIEQTDLTESRINEDFVDWLKTKGPTWLLIVLVVITGYLLYNRWRQHQVAQVNQAWIDLANTDRPESLEEVAETHSDIYAVPLLARGRAADAYLNAVLTGRDFSDDPALAPQLTDEQRSDYLSKADRLYESIVAGAAELDDDYDTLPHVVYALFGRAAVAEAMGDIEAAKRIYEDAAQRAEVRYPALAQQARTRIENAEEAAKAVYLPGTAELPTRGAGEARTPLEIDDSLRDLIFPETAPIVTDPPPDTGSSVFGEGE